jgi:hypothetical protein
LSSSIGLQAGLVTVQCLSSHTWKQSLHVRLQRLRFFRLNSGTEDLLLLLQVAIHYQGKFYEFVPWKGKVEWEIAPWGSWKMTAQSKTHEVFVVGRIIIACDLARNLKLV